MGNVRVGTKFRLTGAPGDASTLALNGFVTLATGDDAVDSDDMGYGVGLDWRLSKWVINVGYQDLGDFDLPLGGNGFPNLRSAASRARPSPAASATSAG